MKPIIKFQEVTVTPAMATEWLEALNRSIETGAFAQRKPSTVAVDRMAADMKRGNFALTHQAIAFNQAGHLIDGRQRLIAITQAGVGVRMVVATNVPNKHASKSVAISTMDMIDSGRNRTFGQVLTGIHAVENGYLVAAIIRTVVELVTRSTISVTKPQGMEIRHLLGEEIALIITTASHGEIERRATVLAPMVIAATVDRARTVEFLEMMCKVENIPAQSPVLALRRWLAAKGGSSGKQRRASSLVTCNALVGFIHSQPVTTLAPNFEGLEIILKEASPITKKINVILANL